MSLGYIDPATGSMILQIILGGVAAAVVTVKMWWHRVLRLLRIRKPDEDEAPIETAPAALESEALDGVHEPAGKH